MRADRLIVARGLAPSRTLAQRLIEAGAVRASIGGQLLTVARGSHELPEDAMLSVAESPETRYVSRGGLKLEAALARTGIDVRGRVALDVGLSTGGFADCLLAHGAARVVGIDVGHRQLAPRLRDEPRLWSFEGINARTLAAADLGDAMPAGGFELAVIDVSFISLDKVLPSVAALLAPGADLVALVKPQFEVGPAGIGKGGIVADRSLLPAVRERITACCEACGLPVLDWFDCPVPGGDGNRECFVHARRRDAAPADPACASIEAGAR